VLVVEKRQEGGGNALFAGGFLWDVRGGEAVRHVETLFFGKTDRSVAEVYVSGLNDLRSWIGKLGGEAVGVEPPPGSFPAVLPSWPYVPGSNGVEYWVVGGQPSRRRGEARWHLLSQNLAARAITVNYGHAAATLTVSEGGRVSGAVVTGKHGRQLVTASHGVVLACGGFEADDYFKDAFLCFRYSASATAGACAPALSTASWAPRMTISGAPTISPRCDKAGSGGRAARKSSRVPGPGAVRAHPDANRLQCRGRSRARRAVRTARRVHGRSCPG
jgi:FAD binding domain